MKEERYCQSCGMPLTRESDLGTNRDGSRNEDYCVHCYQNGGFTARCTMEEMIDFNLNCEGSESFFPDKAAAKAMMEQWFPTLKRWKKER